MPTVVGEVDHAKNGFHPTEILTAIVGASVGGLVYSRPLSVLFLSIGAGAVFQVAFAISRQMIWKEMGKRQIPVTVFAGVLAGMLMLYASGLALK